ncbi:MAG: PEP-CTERM sorting domain-containing protein [Verrucomicrobia bacterium]|nr:PEP-CTERM sorting domain-containing protein [Verrucomicrobiota bacterium]
MKTPSYLSFAVAAMLAASAQGAVLWTTTFSGTVNNAGNASRVITNTPSGSFTDTLATTTSALTRSSTGGNFFLTGTGNTFANYNPNQNVDNATGAGWNSIFDFGTGTQTIELSDVTFNIFRFNSSGATQATDTFLRNVNISAEYTLNGGTSWTPLAATKLVNLTNSNTTTGVNIALNYALGTPVTVDLATDDFRIRYSVLNDNANVGAYNGISSMVFNGDVVPEPSAALLGGFGLLGLLRRRRS